MARDIWRELGLSDEDYRKICEDMEREPSYLELNMYGVMWSEHCSYRRSRNFLQLFPTEKDHVLQGPGGNAGVVDVGEGWGVCFKIESHNHPSAVEPYQGSSTGVGGILRDILAMGARPVALLNSLRFGDVTSSVTRHLLTGVVKGIGDYGNCIGVPTVGGEVYFHSSYRYNPLVNAMAVGLAPKDCLVQGSAREVGASVLLLGAPTGKDGIQGVTFASETLSSDPEASRPAVQVADPFMGKLLLECCLELVEAGLISGMQDLGGAGLTCASAEMASRGGTGMELHLEKVHCREANMSPYEIMLSESQERMLLVINQEYLSSGLEIIDKWDIPYSVIGKVTDRGNISIRMQKEILAEVPADSLAEGAPICSLPRQQPAYIKKNQGWTPKTLPASKDLQGDFFKMLNSPTVASKEWVWRQYDHTVRTCTVQGPGAGDAAVIKIRGTTRGLALTVDGNNRQVFLDPFTGGALAVAEALRNISCVGAKPLGITDCLNFGNPEDPEIYWQFVKTVEGMAQACNDLEVPVVGGNVSFYNDSGGFSIFPSPVVGAVGILEEVGRTVSLSFKNSGDALMLLGGASISLGGSQYLETVYGKVEGTLPPLNLEKEKVIQELVRELIVEGIISSAHDISEGGIAVALAECCMAGDLGASVSLSSQGELPETLLFGEGSARVLVSLPEDRLPLVTQKARDRGVDEKFLGRVTSQELDIRVDGKSLIKTSTCTMKRFWDGALPEVMEKPE